MPVNLKGRSILTLDELTPVEIRFLLRLAAELKAAKHAGTERQRLRGKNIALIFEKDSTRTRTGFEVAAYDQGAHVTYLGPTGTQIGHKESMKDTARVLGRTYDAIEFRGSSQQSARQLAEYSGIPVYNGLTDEAHPTQALADFMTMREFTHKHLSDMAVAFMGDVRNNVASSLALGAMKLGMDMRLCGPRELWPEKIFSNKLLDIAATTNARLRVCDDAAEGLLGADFVYTDVWLSMGEPKEIWGERIRLLEPYRVTKDTLLKTENPHAKFMHCLPAFHNTETRTGAQIAQEFGIECMEVTDEVFESEASIVFDQAENRMHTIKAILVATLGA
ncbi:MAG: ornithine carbamoyltransferase [Hyphomicrobiaceae bacterium]|nr:MAG: ornithine carbamoyltransferase [Hyphomicrobiaceae bacterium]